MDNNTNKYPVNDLYFTIQGEGVHTGIPAVFLRLHGCPVACPFCDTKETWEFDPAQEQTAIDDVKGANGKHVWKTGSEINAYIVKHFGAAKWVVITGGEPALYNLKGLVTALHDGGYQVAIETSGIADGLLDAGLDWITVSPKMNMPGGKKLIPAILAMADEIKHVVGKQADIDRLDGLLSCIDIKQDCTICLQPISQAERATALCIETAQKRAWRLSIQTHKYIQIA